MRVTPGAVIQTHVTMSKQSVSVGADVRVEASVELETIKQPLIYCCNQ